MPILFDYILKWYGMVYRRLPELTVPRLYFISSCLSAKLTKQIVHNLCHIIKYLCTNVFT